MKIDFENNLKSEDAKSELSLKVRAILGLPAELLTEETITSPVFISKSSRYINRKIKEYEGLDETLLEIAFIYYICYLLCPGMYGRVPKEMKNVSTQTILQSTDWNKLALEMLDKCDELLNDLIEEADDTAIPGTFAVLSEESEYPNTMI